MALHDAYAQGFCKVANDAGLDSATLVKIAGDPDFLSSIINAYKSLDPATRRALLTSLITGISTYSLSNGSTGNRLLKGLGAAALGGFGMYGLESSGLVDKGMKYIK
jgi:hypothetical protein